MTTYEYRSYICNNKIINLLQRKPIGFMWICDFISITHSYQSSIFCHLEYVISYRITYSYRSSIFCHLEYMILYIILAKSPDLESRLASCYIRPCVRHFQIKTYVSDRYIPHASTRLHTNVEAISVITRLSIYYKESQLDSCGYVISYQL